MNISPASISAEAETTVIPEGKLAYFRERQRNRLYDFIVSRFLEKERKQELSRAELARKIHKKPEQITRFLSSPGNWTLDTISDLMLGISDAEIAFEASGFDNRKRNISAQEVIGHITASTVKVDNAPATLTVKGFKTEPNERFKVSATAHAHPYVQSDVKIRNI